MNQKIYKIKISEMIKEYRGEHKLSQNDFGRLIGVSAQAVFKWENEVCFPDITLLPSLADILRCKIDDFFE